MPLVILVFALLVAVVAGCSHSARYDGRLVTADSLMQVNPDSSLAIVEGLCRDSLATEGDRAYRDLLLTQARYRCYITATSDSDINRALAYYRSHPKEREKLTRANIYKGAVMDELGFPDSAMLYYKQAEAVADTADYFNLGYVKMRMGTLYRDHYSFDGLPEQKFEEAIDCFRRTDEKHYLLVCSIDLAALYRLNDERGAHDLYAECMSLASELKDTVNYAMCLKGLTGLYYFCKRYEQGRIISQKVMKDYSDYIDEDFCYNASKIYAKSGMLDSAYYFYNLVRDASKFGPIERTTYLECMSVLALAQNDTLEHLRREKELNTIVDSLMVDKKRQQILAIENEFEKDLKTQLKKRQLRKILLLTSLVFLLTLIAAALIYRNKHRYNQLINDLMEESQNHVSDINTLRRNIDQLKIRDSQLKDFITSYIELMGDVTEACYHSPKNVLSNEISRLFQIKEENKDRWVELYSYIDNEYNQIITDTINKYSQLNDRDILLLALTCLDFSCAQIAIITGYSNATSISGNRQRLAKKMGLDHSLQEYINQYKSPQESN